MRFCQPCLDGGAHTIPGLSEAEKGLLDETKNMGERIVRGASFMTRCLVCGIEISRGQHAMDTISRWPTTEATNP